MTKSREASFRTNFLWLGIMNLEQSSERVGASDSKGLITRVFWEGVYCTSYYDKNQGGLFVKRPDYVGCDQSCREIRDGRVGERDISSSKTSSPTYYETLRGYSY